MPYPAKDGGSIASLSLAESMLVADSQVKILSMNTSKHYIDKSELPVEFVRKFNFEYVDINTDLSIFNAVKNLIFSRLPYNGARFVSKKFSDRLKLILQNENFDIVQLEGLYLVPYIDTIRKFSNSKIALRAHNIEHEIWHRTALNENSALKRLYLKILAKRIKQLKLRYLNSYDFLIPITERDGRRYNYFGNRKPQLVVQTGVEITDYVIKNDNCEYPGLFHLGALDWMPNQEGLIWFLENVWTIISQDHPQLKFYIAGRNAPKSLEQSFLKYKNVIFYGEVNDAQDFMNSKSVMIVPLLSGSGMRIKIIEGMALGKIIISTKIGTEGIKTDNGQNIIIASTAEDFIKEIKNMLINKADYDKISRNAVKFVAENYDNKQIAKELLCFYEKYL